MDTENKAEDAPPPYENYEHLKNAEPKMKARLKTRVQWGACEPTLREPLVTPVSKVILTCTNTKTCSSESECMERCREIQNDHMKQGEPDIKPNFLLGGDGSIYEGRGYATAGPVYPMTDKKLNEMSKTCLDIAVIGKMEDLDSKTTLRAAADCMIMASVKKYLHKQFELYWIEDDKILQMLPIAPQQLGAMQTA